MPIHHLTRHRVGIIVFYFVVDGKYYIWSGHLISLCGKAVYHY